MILHMSNAKGAHGRALYRYLEQVWKASDTTANAWAWEHGFQPPTVNRWGKETDPDLATLEHLAAALNLRLIDVLLIGEYITNEDVQGRNIPEPAKPSVLVAIQVDESLSEDSKQALAHIYREMQQGANVVDTRRKRGKPSTKP